ncbi:hypothetical protein [endosymbiont GvMRE of Glomus versiforme]|uniref:hypothetical protein n=1 Tax=endosymbiont GvMRE of Glomus versiforme TaxID=2039283 RepID=UPI000ED159B8|nr:hypothetical protein [endosymbiont GvMRE of Glomus versiforme]RHZ36833.1 hypothetical protein GvMRE_I2g298 [endosymbiont GvMRE of Glomus versiforme]
MPTKIPTNISLKKGFFILVVIVILVALFFIVYSYNYAYKTVMKSKCKVCDKKLDNKFKRVMKYMWTPWREPRFICQNCQKTKK